MLVQWIIPNYIEGLAFALTELYPISFQTICSIYQGHFEF